MLFDEPKKGKVRGKAGRGKHSSGMKELSVHERKSRKTRKTLTIIIALLIVILLALGYFVFHLVSTSQTVAEQQTQSSAASSHSLDTDTSKDANTITSKKTDVPDLASVLDKTQDEAVAALGHGAQVRDSRDVNDEGSAIKKSVTVPLTDDRRQQNRHAFGVSGAQRRGQGDTGWVFHLDFGFGLWRLQLR